MTKPPRGFPHGGQSPRDAIVGLRGHGAGLFDMAEDRHKPRAVAQGVVEVHRPAARHHDDVTDARCDKTICDEIGYSLHALRGVAAATLMETLQKLKSYHGASVHSSNSRRDTRGRSTALSRRRIQASIFLPMANCRFADMTPVGEIPLASSAESVGKNACADGALPRAPRFREAWHRHVDAPFRACLCRESHWAPAGHGPPADSPMSPAA